MTIDATARWMRIVFIDDLRGTLIWQMSEIARAH